MPWLLFAVFLILKLTGVIAWSWVWVAAPLWIGLALAVVLYGLVFLGIGTFGCLGVLAGMPSVKVTRKTKGW